MITSEVQKAAYRCCGENAPQLSNTLYTNWVEMRNKFLANVAHNGADSHQDIINVLIWFSQWHEDYPEPNEPELEYPQ